MSTSEPTRSPYEGVALSEEDLNSDPLAELRAWIERARNDGLPEPGAMCLATVGGEAQPSARMVLLRGLDSGLVFFTSYGSRNGRDLAANPRAAAVFYWPQIQRQIRIEGRIEQVAESESDAYFASRPRGHQLSAWASEQSDILDSREILERRLEDFDLRFGGQSVPRPHSWGGYRLIPHRIEFWQGRVNRMHDRLEFTRTGAEWQLHRLSP